MGERRTLRIGWSGGASGVVELAPPGRIAPLPADHVERHRAAYLDELRHFVECVAAGTAPCVGGADSVAALELSLAAERCVA
jgi:predicted dehydrogenase